MIITKDEFSRIAMLQDAAKEIANRIDIYLPFKEDPASMYETIQERVEEINYQLAMLLKVDAGLREQKLR